MNGARAFHDNALFEAIEGDRLRSEEIEIVKDCGLVNWDDWKKKQSAQIP